MSRIADGFLDPIAHVVREMREKAADRLTAYSTLTTGPTWPGDHGRRREIIDALTRGLDRPW